MLTALLWTCLLPLAPQDPLAEVDEANARRHAKLPCSQAQH